MSYTLRTQTIYNYILQCHDHDDIVPTMREIAAACQLPLTTISRHLDWLEFRGYISRSHTARSLRLLKPLLTDEEQVYRELIHSLKASSLAPSLKRLCQTTHLSSSRVKVALQFLAQSGHIQPDPDDPRLFYPIKFEAKS